MAMDILPYTILLMLSVLSTFIAVREGGFRQEQRNWNISQIGGLFSAFLWALFSFHSFEVIRVAGVDTSGSSSDILVYRYAWPSMAILGAMLFVIMLAYAWYEVITQRADDPDNPRASEMRT